MRKLGLIAAATVACGALSFAGAAAAGTTFGQMGIGTGGAPVTFTSDNAGGGTFSGGGSLLFSEISRITDQPLGSAFAVNFSLNATSVGPVTSFNGDVLQAFTGFFTVSVGAGGGMFNGQMLNAGDQLLRADFSNATFLGSFSSTNANVLAGKNVNFTSGVFDLSGFTGESFELGFGSISGGLQPAATGGGFGSFTALVNGKVDAGGDIGIAPIPEPATWAMMIGGFGMIGAALRRRRALVEA